MSRTNVLHHMGGLSQDYLSLRGSGFSTSPGGGAAGLGWGSTTSKGGGGAPLSKGGPGNGSTKAPLRKSVGSGIPVLEEGPGGAKAFRPGSANRPGSGRRPSTSSGGSGGSVPGKVEEPHNGLREREREDGHFTWDKAAKKGDKDSKSYATRVNGGGSSSFNAPQNPLPVPSSAGRRPSTGGWDGGSRGVRRGRAEDDPDQRHHRDRLGYAGMASGRGTNGTESSNSSRGGDSVSNGDTLPSRKAGDTSHMNGSSRKEHSQHAPPPRHHPPQPASSDGDGSSSSSSHNSNSQHSQQSHRSQRSQEHNHNAAAAAAGGGGGGGGVTGGLMVTIHVCDEARGITRDFYCERQLLLSEMKYFRGYLEDACGSYDEIDIMVHCDVRIFEWLFDYIHIHGKQRPSKGKDCHTDDKDKRRDKDKEKEKEMNGGKQDSEEKASSVEPPKLEISSAVSILISSAFLQMDRLVGECLAFVNAHLSEVVKLPIDLSCINEEMVARLARMASLQELASAKDHKDKLLSRIHKKRIELDFRERNPSNTIFCCRHCHQLFPEKALEEMACPMAPPVVNFRGKLIRRHEVMQPWSLTQLVTALHRRGMSWTDVFWFLWGLTQVHHCTECGEIFTAGDLGQCRSHSQGPVFATEHTLEGVYPCCNRSAKRFSPEAPPPGCTSGDHALDLSVVEAASLQLLQLQRKSITYEDWRDAVQEEGRTLAGRSGTPTLTSTANRECVNGNGLPPKPQRLGQPADAACETTAGGSSGGQEGSSSQAHTIKGVGTTSSSNSSSNSNMSGDSSSNSVSGHDTGGQGQLHQHRPRQSGGMMQLCLVHPHTSLPPKMTALLPDQHPLHVQPVDLQEEWRSLDRDRKDISDVNLRKFRMDIQREADEARMATLSAALIAKRKNSCASEGGRSSPACNPSARPKGGPGGTGSGSAASAAAGNGANAVYKQSSAAATAAQIAALLHQNGGAPHSRLNKPSAVR